MNNAGMEKLKAFGTGIELPQPTRMSLAFVENSGKASQKRQPLSLASSSMRVLGTQGWLTRWKLSKRAGGGWLGEEMVSETEPWVGAVVGLGR